MSILYRVTEVILEKHNSGNVIQITFVISSLLTIAL